MSKRLRGAGPRAQRAAAAATLARAQILHVARTVGKLDDLGISGEKHEIMRGGRGDRKAITERD
jgi:hypothetical protein